MKKSTFTKLAISLAITSIAAIAAPIAIHFVGQNQAFNYNKEIIEKMQTTDRWLEVEKDLKTIPTEQGLQEYINEQTDDWTNWIEGIDANGNVNTTFYTIESIDVNLPENQAPTFTFVLNWIDGITNSSLVESFSTTYSDVEPITLTFATPAAVQTEILKYIPNATNLTDLRSKIEALTTAQLIAIKDVAITSANKDQISTVTITAAAGSIESQYNLTLTFIPVQGVTLDEASKTTTMAVTIESIVEEITLEFAQAAAVQTEILKYIPNAADLTDLQSKIGTLTPAQLIAIKDVAITSANKDQISTVTITAAAGSIESQYNLTLTFVPLQDVTLDEASKTTTMAVTIESIVEEITLEFAQAAAVQTEILKYIPNAADLTDLQSKIGTLTPAQLIAIKDVAITSANKDQVSTVTITAAAGEIESQYNLTLTFVPLQDVTLDEASKTTTMTVTIESIVEEIKLEFAQAAAVQTEILKYIPNAADLTDLQSKIGTLTSEQLIAIKDVAITSANKDQVSTVTITAAAGEIESQYNLTLTFVPLQDVTLAEASKTTTMTVTIESIVEEITLEFAQAAAVQTEILKYIPNATDLTDLQAKIGTLTPAQLIAIKDVAITSANKDQVSTVTITAAAGEIESQYNLTLTFVPLQDVTLAEASKTTTMTVTIESIVEEITLEFAQAAAVQTEILKYIPNATDLTDLQAKIGTLTPAQLIAIKDVAITSANKDQVSTVTITAAAGEIESQYNLTLTFVPLLDVTLAEASKTTTMTVTIESIVEEITLEFAQAAAVQTEILKYIPNAADLTDLQSKIGTLTSEQLIAIKDVAITSANKDQVSTVTITAAAGEIESQYNLTLTFVPLLDVTLAEASKTTTMTVVITPAPLASLAK